MTEKCSFRAGPRGPLSPPDGTSRSWSTNYTQNVARIVLMGWQIVEMAWYVDWCFWWEIRTITNEEAAWSYVITNMNNTEQSERTNVGSQISNLDKTISFHLFNLVVTGRSIWQTTPGPHVVMNTGIVRVFTVNIYHPVVKLHLIISFRPS
jgi:hypothetical protein